jgi:hypothetical protein
MTSGTCSFQGGDDAQKASSPSAELSSGCRGNIASPFTGASPQSGSYGYWEPGFAGEGGMAPVARMPVAASADQEGAAPAVADECGGGVPVSGAGLMSFRALECLLRGIIRPGILKLLSNSQAWLALVIPIGDCVVVAWGQAREQPGIELVLPVVAGGFDGGKPLVASVELSGWASPVTSRLPAH